MNTILDDTFRFFKENIVAITFLTLSIEFPFIFFANIDIVGEMPGIIDLWIFIVIFVFAFIVTPFSTGAQTSLYSRIINSGDNNLRECVSDSKDHILSLAIAFLCFFLLISLGLLLFIFPGVYIGARLSFFPFFIIYEGYKPYPALLKSYHATRDYWGKIAAPILIINFFIIVAQLILSMIFDKSGVLSFLAWIAIESFFAVVGWLSLIVAFRFYCIYKNENSLN